jgi:hypothetical protein
MRNGLLIGVGLLVTIAGIIFALQGAGVIGGSSMSGTSLWAVLGPLIALAGIALAALGLWHARPAKGTTASAARGNDPHGRPR